MSFNLHEKQAQAKRQEWVGTIEAMLQKSFGEYAGIVREETLQSNLGKDRTETDPVDTEEAWLEKARSGNPTATTEGRLNTEQGVFNRLRDPTGGNVPKLEEKRLKEKPVEKEKYESAVE